MRMINARTTRAELSVAAPPRARRRSWLRSAEARHQAWGYLFLAPMFVLLAVFKFIPMLQALYLSLTSYDLLSPPRFVGFRNYVTLLHDPLFHQSVGATLYYVFGTCVPLWFPGSECFSSRKFLQFHTFRFLIFAQVLLTKGLIMSKIGQTHTY